MPRKVRLQYPGAMYPGANHPEKMRLESAEAKADRLIAEELARLGWAREDLATHRKSDPSKMLMAARLRRETTLTVRRIAEKLELGRPEGVTHLLKRRSCMFKNLAPAVILLSLLTAASVLVSCDTRPLTYRPILADGKADQYAPEFVRSLTVITNYSDGRPMRTPHRYFPSPDRAASPNGSFVVTQVPLRDYHHKIEIADLTKGSPETIVVLREGAPESGRGHGIAWSSDSKAVFIYGSAQPVRYDRNTDMALIYLVEQKTLHSVDIRPLLNNNTH